MLPRKSAVRVAPVPRKRAPLPRRTGCGEGQVLQSLEGSSTMKTQRADRPVIEHRDHYQEITSRIVAALESGTKPWRQPWDNAKAGGPTLPVNATTGRPYHGINVLVLAMSAFAFGRGDPRFCSYKQAADRGWQVRKGERGTQIFFFKRMEVADRDAPAGAEERTKRIPMLRSYTVFNGAQIDGIPPWQAPDVAEVPWRCPEAADLILHNSGARVHCGGSRAFYSPANDIICHPPLSSFDSPEAFGVTMLHELGHWTSHEDRLNRDVRNKFGSEKYAQEELRAELASVFIGATLGLPCDIPNHADYIAAWVEVLKNDKREIFRAASEAQRIANYLLAFHPDYAQAHPAASAEADGAEHGPQLVTDAA